MAKRSFMDRVRGVFGLRPRRASGFATSYKGATIGGLHSDWILSPLSADQTARYDLSTLRVRARELVINDPIASRIPKLFSENIVGENGFTLQANVSTTRGDPHAANNAKLEAAFYDWADNFCTVDGRLTFVDVQSMAVENEVTDGEFIVRLVRGFDNPYGFALELIDPDQLDHTLNIPDTGRGTSIRMGVEVDAWRRPVTYWLLKHHPSERGFRDWNKVPAADILHLYTADRPQQTRGVTRFAPVMLNLKMLSGGKEAVLVAMRAAACNSVMFETQPGESPPEGYPDSSASIPTDLDPGMAYQLPPGIKATFNSPPFADSAFDPFELGILRGISSALDVSYASLSGDVTQASYGSQRAALLPEQASWRKKQRRMILKFLTPIYRAWLREALLSGALQLDSFDPTRYENVTWHPRSFEWIDPLKDAEAEDVKVGMGVQTRTRIANANGDDFKALVDEQAAEIEYARSKGVPLFIGGIDVTHQFDQQAGKGSATATGDNSTVRDQQKVESRPLRVVGDTQ